MSLKVTPVAVTTFALPLLEGTEFRDRLDEDTSADADLLAEFAGRACYQSWSLPNPATAENEGYLGNILSKGHESVLEHASITFYVEGVSRSLTHELIRHRHLSFSELSQRFVDVEKAPAVVPPALRDEIMKARPDDYEDALRQAEEDGAGKDAIADYRDIYEMLRERGVSKKAAREAARSVMPNMIETKIVVTGNIRAWRDVLKKRYHVAADAEIREFAEKVLAFLRVLAPNSVQDIPEQPYGS